MSVPSCTVVYRGQSSAKTESGKNNHLSHIKYFYRGAGMITGFPRYYYWKFILTLGLNKDWQIIHVYEGKSGNKEKASSAQTARALISFHALLFAGRNRMRGRSPHYPYFPNDNDKNNSNICFFPLFRPSWKGPDIGLIFQTPLFLHSFISHLHRVGGRTIIFPAKYFNPYFPNDDDDDNSYDTRFPSLF